MTNRVTESFDLAVAYYWPPLGLDGMMIGWMIDMMWFRLAWRDGSRFI